MHILSNPLARKPVIPRIPPENLRSIGPGITENCPERCFGGEIDLQQYSTDFLIWITSLSKKNYNLENHILEIQGDP